MIGNPAPDNDPKMQRTDDRRVVITGMSVISPLGNTVSQLWDAIQAGESGVRPFPQDGTDSSVLAYGGIASDFTGELRDFGDLDAARKKTIRKGLKLMCREIRMGVAAAQLALQHSGVLDTEYDPERCGVVFGCDHISTIPTEFVEAYQASCGQADQFSIHQWGKDALSQVTPLWLLKYLPNMPASHVAIYNDFRACNNSLTYREPSANSAVGEAFNTIRRGSADCMLAGATGCNVSPIRAFQFAFHTETSRNGSHPSQACRPFDRRRSGAVAGEGAAAILLEERETAIARGANIYGEICGHASSVVMDRNSVANLRRSVANSLSMVMKNADWSLQDIGHIHAHGVGTRHSDREEALGIRDAIGAAADSIPVTAAKSYFGNLGASSGLVELIASLKAIEFQRLFPILNCDQPDPECPIQLAVDAGCSPGQSVLNISFSLNGQSSAVAVRGNGTASPTP